VLKVLTEEGHGLNLENKRETLSVYISFKNPVGFKGNRRGKGRGNREGDRKKSEHREERRVKMVHQEEDTGEERPSEQMKDKWGFWYINNA